MAFLVYGLQHNKNMARGGLKKSCPACHEYIYNGYKVCPMCKAPQTQQLRLKKKLAKFKKEKDTWVANTKKNQMASHLLDDAVILVSNLRYITIVLRMWHQNDLGPGGSRWCAMLLVYLSALALMTLHSDIH